MIRIKNPDRHRALYLADAQAGTLPPPDANEPDAMRMSQTTENICSCVVHARPGGGEDVAARLCALPGVEVHAGAEVDRLVVTIEDTPYSLAADTIGTLNDVAGVINTGLIYHYGGDDIAPQTVPSE